MPDTSNATQTADVTEQLAASPTWGQGGSYVLDPATGERMTEAQWLARQHDGRASAKTDTEPTVKTKGN